MGTALGLALMCWAMLGATPAALASTVSAATKTSGSAKASVSTVAPKPVAVRKTAPRSAAAKSKAAKAKAPRARAKAFNRRTARAEARRPPSFGQQYGLRATEDALDLSSSVAFVVDQDTDEVLFSKNSDAVLPIASITKLMTALVVTEAKLPLDEMLTVTPEDAAIRAGSRTTLRAGNRLTRGEMLHLALMSSENRAAHLLGRTYPGGLSAFVEAMNAKAQLLGMSDTRYVEPTGLSSDNQSSARDLSMLVRAAAEHPVLREFSTTPNATVPVGRRQVEFRNTNALIRNPDWDIGLQKTGYISAAGRCVVMQTQMAGRKLIMVLLDSAGKYSRIGDAERLRKWLAETRVLPDLPELQDFPRLKSLPPLSSLGLGRAAAIAAPALVSTSPPALAQPR